ncbi:hypothetical protein OUZ56_001535 [Daphnia magna]|uniref:Secreted protein n=1 Tax=Daphnia magna TaxID=35525 RepID=A0ABR0A2Z2_9CRUS|nr:hypothetical protein OUZ56_001535 [Daphnia magna]
MVCLVFFLLNLSVQALTIMDRFVFLFVRRNNTSRNVRYALSRLQLLRILHFYFFSFMCISSSDIQLPRPSHWFGFRLSFTSLSRRLGLFLAGLLQHAFNVRHILLSHI